MTYLETSVTLLVSWNAKTSGILNGRHLIQEIEYIGIEALKKKKEDTEITLILVTARSSHNLRAEETKGKMWGYLNQVHPGGTGNRTQSKVAGTGSTQYN